MKPISKLLFLLQPTIKRDAAMMSASVKEKMRRRANAAGQRQGLLDPFISLSFQLGEDTLSKLFFSEPKWANTTKGITGSSEFSKKKRLSVVRNLHVWLSARFNNVRFRASFNNYSTIAPVLR